MFRFWKSRKDPAPDPAGEGAGAGSSTGPRMIDVAGLIRQASTLVSVGQLLRRGKRDIHLLSRDKIDQLISRALKQVVERYRAAGALDDPRLRAQMEEDSKKEFRDLLGQHR